MNYNYKFDQQLDEQDETKQEDLLQQNMNPQLYKSEQEAQKQKEKRIKKRRKKLKKLINDQNLQRLQDYDNHSNIDSQIQFNNYIEQLNQNPRQQEDLTTQFRHQQGLQNQINSGYQSYQIDQNLLQELQNSQNQDENEYEEENIRNTGQNVDRTMIQISQINQQNQQYLSSLNERLIRNEIDQNEYSRNIKKYKQREKLMKKMVDDMCFLENFKKNNAHFYGNNTRQHQNLQEDQWEYNFQQRQQFLNGAYFNRNLQDINHNLNDNEENKDQEQMFQHLEKINKLRQILYFKQLQEDFILNDQIDFFILDKMIQIHTNSSSIKISFEGLQISEQDVEKITCILQKLKKATKLLLDFSNCDIDNNTLTQIIEGIKTIPQDVKVLNLNLSENRFDYNGVKMMIISMKRMRALSILDLQMHMVNVTQQQQETIKEEVLTELPKLVGFYFNGQPIKGIIAEMKKEEERRKKNEEKIERVVKVMDSYQSTIIYRKLYNILMFFFSIILYAQFITEQEECNYLKKQTNQEKNLTKACGGNCLYGQVAVLMIVYYFVSSIYYHIMQVLLDKAHKRLEESIHNVEDILFDYIIESQFFNTYMYRHYFGIEQKYKSIMSLKKFINFFYFFCMFRLIPLYSLDKLQCSNRKINIFLTIFSFWAISLLAIFIFIIISALVRISLIYIQKYKAYQRKRRFLKFPKKKYKYIKNQINSQECTICLQDYNDQDQIIVLPCQGKHAFHDICIVNWLKENPTCVICRQNINIDENNSIIQNQNQQSQNDQVSIEIYGGQLIIDENNENQ